jgi:hypothetical protein
MAVKTTGKENHKEDNTLVELKIYNRKFIVNCTKK